LRAPLIISWCLTRIGDQVGDLTTSDAIHLTEKGSIFLIDAIIDRVLNGQTAPTTAALQWNRPQFFPYRCGARRAVRVARTHTAVTQRDPSSSARRPRERGLHQWLG
jgi:hypothetical protein